VNSRFLVQCVFCGVLAFVAPIVTGCAASPTSKPPADRRITIAAVSVESRLRDVQGNLDRIEAWARRADAAGADLILFPETAISGWWASREIRKYAEPLDGPSVTRLIRLARELDTILCVGMTERDGSSAYITQVLLDGKGIIGAHRKSELPAGEEKFWDPGSDANVFEIHGIRIGIAICYESVHPRICAALRAGGAEIILAPHANGTDPNELVTSKRRYPFERVRENRLWYVACDCPPHDENRRLRRGAAYVIDPSGELAAISSPEATGENMIVYTIQLAPASSQPAIE